MILMVLPSCCECITKLKPLVEVENSPTYVKFDMI
jgi:hypothetical protein